MCNMDIDNGIIKLKDEGIILIDDILDINVLAGS